VEIWSRSSEEVCGLEFHWLEEVVVVHTPYLVIGVSLSVASLNLRARCNDSLGHSKFESS